MTAVTSFCGLCLLLIIGKFLRMRFSLFQRLYLPSSVIAGVVGLCVVFFGGERVPAGWYAGWSDLPSFLINIVFAALFLGVSTPGLKKIWRVSAPQLCYGQIVAWGQYVVGALVVMLILNPLFDVGPAFAALIEVGFEGGHGTVAGLSDTFAELGWAQGKDLGFTVATVGMIAGVVLGNQSVLLRGVNDDPAVMRSLVHRLLMMRVRPYYLYACDMINGSSHFRVPAARGVEIIRALRGWTSGYAVPQFVIDAPGGGGKVPVNPDYVEEISPDGRVRMRNFRGDEYVWGNGTAE